MTTDWNSLITQWFHQSPGEYGNDFALKVGTPIYSPIDGVFASESLGKDAWGNRAFVHGANGFTFAVGHLTSFAQTAGARVKRGDIVGYSGGAISDPNSGNTSGPHVEVQFMDPKGYVDPQAVFSRFADFESTIFEGAGTATASTGGGATLLGFSGLPNANDFGTWGASGAQIATGIPDAITNASNSVTSFFLRMVWLGLGSAIILLGLMLLVFDDLKAGFTQVGQAAIQSSPETKEAAGVIV